MKTLPRWLIVAFAASVLAILAGGVSFYVSQRLHLRQEAESDLQAIAESKVREIVRWRAERLGDASVLMEGPFAGDTIARWMARPQAEDAEALLASFRSLQAHYHYVDVLLVDAGGKVRLSLGGQSESPGDDATSALASAFRTRQAVLGDLHASPQAPTPHLDAIAPFFAGDGRASVPLGAVLLRSDARQFLYPLIQSWPVPSPSAESLLVRRDGGAALFLNDLRHQRDAALRLRIPLSRTNVPAVMAVLGGEGVFEGTDYRGVGVLSVVRTIPDSPWSLVAKVDSAEVFAAWRFRSVLILALVLGAVVLTATGALFAWQRAAMAHYRALYHAEAAERQSEERFRSTFEQAAVGIAHVKTDGHWLRVNRRLCDILGYTQGELLQKTFQSVTHPDDVEADLAHKGQMLEGEIQTYSMEKRYIRKDGSIVPIALTVSLARETSGEPQHFISVVEDITERTRLADELRRHRDELEALVEQRTRQLAESERRLSSEMTAVAAIVGEILNGESTDAETEMRVLKACLAATDSVYGMIGVINEHGRYDVTTYSGRALQDCAFPAALAWKLSSGMEIRGIWGWPLIHAQPLICNTLQDHPDRVGQPEGHVPIDCYLGVPIRRDGKVVGLMAVANKPGGYTALDQQTLNRLIDVMAMSREHRDLLADLDRRVRDRTAQLEESNRELEAFSYSVSHDLRAPLRAIDGFTRILVDDHAQQLPPEGLRVCSVVRENAAKMGRLIDDLLAFSRLGRVEISPFWIDMGAMATSVFHELTTPQSAERIDLRIGAVPAAAADSALMRQVWMNLLGNAIKFSSRRERAVIEVQGRHEPDGTVYSVRDNGVGFDMQYVGKLFGVFQRLHSVKEFEGTGVGLAIVQRVVHRHGGRVWAEGEPGRGATFYFSLPRKGA